MDAVSTKDEYNEIVNGMKQKAASDEQFMKALEMAKVAPGLGKPVDKTSPMGQADQGALAGALPGAS